MKSRAASPTAPPFFLRRPHCARASQRTPLALAARPRPPIATTPPYARAADDGRELQSVRRRRLRRPRSARPVRRRRRIRQASATRTCCASPICRSSFCAVSFATATRPAESAAILAAGTPQCNLICTPPLLRAECMPSMARMPSTKPSRRGTSRGSRSSPYAPPLLLSPASPPPHHTAMASLLSPSSSPIGSSPPISHTLSSSPPSGSTGRRTCGRPQQGHSLSDCNRARTDSAWSAQPALPGWREPRRRLPVASISATPAAAVAAVAAAVVAHHDHNRYGRAGLDRDECRRRLHLPAEAS